MEIRKLNLDRFSSFDFPVSDFQFRFSSFGEEPAALQMPPRFNSPTRDQATPDCAPTIYQPGDGPPAERDCFPQTGGGQV